MLIRVSNLDRETTVDDLWDLFAEFGEVKEAEINEYPDPGKDTFTGWVVMPYDEEAKEAISELRGERVDGQFLNIQEAQDKTLETTISTEEDWEEED